VSPNDFGSMITHFEIVFARPKQLITEALVFRAIGTGRNNATVLNE
jgi:hypothetical protein